MTRQEDPLNTLRAVSLSLFAFTICFLPSVPLDAETIISTDVGTTGCCYSILNIYNAEGGWSLSNTFDDVTSAAGLAVHTQYVKWGTAFLDFDNDGWPTCSLPTATCTRS